MRPEDHDPTAIKHLRKLGLGFVVEEAHGLITGVRRETGRDDVMIVAFCEDVGKEINARLYCSTRERIRELLEKEIPEAAGTIEKLKLPISPARYGILIQYKKAIFFVDMPMPSNEGVFN
jgi:hypothetical protein